jgi:hypothetical protein
MCKSNLKIREASASDKNIIAWLDEHRLLPDINGISHFGFKTNRASSAGTLRSKNSSDDRPEENAAEQAQAHRSVEDSLSTIM